VRDGANTVVKAGLAVEHRVQVGMHLGDDRTDVGIKDVAQCRAVHPLAVNLLEAVGDLESDSVLDRSRHRLGRGIQRRLQAP
jgi:hypothetical protein